MKSPEQRRKEAQVRIEAVKALTPAQRLARLDERLGRGVGAKRERTKLAEAMKHKKAPPPVEKTTPSDEKPRKTKHGALTTLLMVAALVGGDAIKV